MSHLSSLLHQKCFSICIVDSVCWCTHWESYNRNICNDGLTGVRKLLNSGVFLSHVEAVCGGDFRIGKVNLSHFLYHGFMIFEWLHTLSVFRPCCCRLHVYAIITQPSVKDCERPYEERMTNSAVSHSARVVHNVIYVQLNYLKHVERLGV